MSIVDEQGRPVAHGWNDEAASEKCKRNPNLRLMDDDEFAVLFPELFIREPAVKH